MATFVNVDPSVDYGGNVIDNFHHAHRILAQVQPLYRIRGNVPFKVR